MYIEKCNCGKDGKYYFIGEGSSCNKYSVCPPYEEVVKQLNKIEVEFLELLRAADGLRTYREGTSHYKDAESVVSKYESKL